MRFCWLALMKAPGDLGAFFGSDKKEMATERYVGKYRRRRKWAGTLTFFQAKQTFVRIGQFSCR
jgi:hypothetical protein